VLARPLLHRHGLPLAAFESSFPSGHTLRAVLLAATAGAVRPGARLWLAAWAAAVLVLLEVDGVHVPTDIAGGLLLAGLVVALARRF
jgi:membrane-associated phospholipid phosphatase